MKYDREAVLDMWAAGKTTDQIAASLSITRNKVAGVIFRARSAGDARAAKHGVNHIPRLVVRGVVERYRRGDPLTEIADWCGRSRGAVSAMLSNERYLRGADIPHRHPAWRRRANA